MLGQAELPISRYIASRSLPETTIKRRKSATKFAYVCAFLLSAIQDIQSLWLTSWLSSGSGSSKRTKSIASGGVGVGIGIAGQEKRSVNVYTLQQPHKFPLQLDVCGGGNCSFDCHQKQQREQREQQELDRIPGASLSWSQRQRRQLRQSCDETKFIESSMGKQQTPIQAIPFHSRTATETITISRQQ